MKRWTAALASAIVAATLAAAATGADGGGPSAGVSWGWDGVVAPGHQIRYVAVPTGRNTVVEAVRVLGGRVLRWTSIEGTFGVPLITVFAKAGGISHDGRTLVLAGATGVPGPHAVTRFAVLRASTLHVLPVVTLHGSFSFDGLSPDASTLYLIQYTSTQDYNRYRVRAYDLATRQLVPGAIVDKREPDEAMAGVPLDRATTPDGRWAYTLYGRQGEPPFVHALDTVKREAYCIDLPLRIGQQGQMRLRLAFRGAHELRVRRGYRTVAVVDLEKLEARRA